MAKLVLSQSDGTVIGHYFLDQERFLIGASDECHLHLNQTGVSRRHAAVLTIGNDQILEDLNSTNGTLVNGEKVERRILLNDDVIDICGFQIRYLNRKATGAMDFEKTMILAPGDHPTPESVHPIDGLDIQVARGTKPGFARARLESLADKAEMVIERPLHAIGHKGGAYGVIMRRPHGFELYAVSGRPVMVNGKDVSAQPVQLKIGDVIAADEEQFRYLGEERTGAS